MHKPLNLFYSEPDPDRWVKFDRYPRRMVRRLVRGPQRPGGVMMVALNLIAGLNRLKISYRFNDYKYIKSHPGELACIIGKPQLLFDKRWNNPILLGAGIYSHPIECPDLLEKYPLVKHVLVPGEWMRQMFQPYYGDKVSVWPTGIDSELWRPSQNDKQFDFLIYDKIRWEYEHHRETLVNPIIDVLRNNKFSFHTIKYGEYSHDELIEKLKVSKSVIFLCEHETQGLAYQQILSANIPILAWDRGGFWQDPYYYPHKVKFQSVSSVPYWDSRCGLKFTSSVDFKEALLNFIDCRSNNSFSPREYILENLTLEKCATHYLDITKRFIE